MKTKQYSTKGLYLGKPEAEGDTIKNGDSPTLLEFFEDYTNIAENINRGRFIISGRKGSGKSAYAMWLFEKSKGNDNLYTSIIKKSEFDIEAMIQAIPSDDIKYEAFFEWLILAKMVKMILNTGIGAYLKQIKSLDDFYKKNSGYIEPDKYRIVEILSNKEINFSPLKKEFLWFSKYFGNKSIKAPFYHMIEPLRRIICEILQMDIFKNISFYVIFDDLDVKFKLTNPKDKVMLMDLIRISRRYTTEYFNNVGARILIFVRDDIAERLDGVDCDKNKIFESYEYRINWYDHMVANDDEKKLLLRRFINRRLSMGFDGIQMPYNHEDPWLSFVNENDKESENEKSLFRFLLDYTFYLPRDLMLIFKDLENQDLRLPLTRKDLNSLLRKYSKRKVKEIKDELFALYDNEDIELIFKVLNDVTKGWNLSYKDVMGLLDKYDLDDSVIDTLIDYSLLVPVDADTKFMYFNYRENDLSDGLDDDWNKYIFWTPKVLSMYFQNR